MTSENHSGDSFIKREKNADCDNSSISESKTSQQWNAAVPGKRVLFRAHRQREPSQRPSENNVSYSKRKTLAGNYPSLRSVPPLVRDLVTETSEPVRVERPSSARPPFDAEHFNGSYARERSDDIPDIERLYLQDRPVDGYAFPVHFPYDGRGDGYRLGFSKSCDSDDDFLSGEILNGSFPHPLTSVDDVDYDPIVPKTVSDIHARSLPKQSLGGESRDLSRTFPNDGSFNASSSYVDSGTYSLSPPNPDFTFPVADSVNGALSSVPFNVPSSYVGGGIYSFSPRSPDYSLPETDWVRGSLSNDAFNAPGSHVAGGTYSFSPRSPDYSLPETDWVRGSLSNDAFNAPGSHVAGRTYSFSPRNQNFTLPETDSVNGFLSIDDPGSYVDGGTHSSSPRSPDYSLSDTFLSPPAVFNRTELEDGRPTSTGSPGSRSVWNSLPDLWPTDIYPQYYLQCMQNFSPAPSDASSVCSVNSTDGTPGRRRPPDSTPTVHGSTGTPAGHHASYKSYLRDDGGTPTGQTKRTFSGISTHADDSPRNGGEISHFLNAPDSEPRCLEARRAFPDLCRRKSFPVSRGSSTNARASTADQTPYSAPEQAEDRQKRMRLLLPHYRPWTLQAYKSDVGFIDTHCHLDFLFQRQDYEGSYADYRKKHGDTFPESYEGCVAIFCNPYTFQKKSMWGKYLEEDGVWAAFGCHPHNASVYDETFEGHLKEALSHPRVVALGEIGVDYSSRNNCSKERQHEVFRRQLKIAKDRSLPLVIHCREANEDCMAILKEAVGEEQPIHLHCFTDTWAWAERWLAAFPNLFLGLTNVVTFPSAECVHEVARRVPLHRLLLETDAPYFLPRAVSRKVRWSHPGLALHVAAQIAALRDIPLDEVLKSVRRNTERMYGI